MTILNVHVSANGVHCLTDTLVYVGAEPVGLCETKCDAIGNGVGAIAGRGAVRTSRMLRELFAEVGAFDVFTDHLRTILQEYEDAGFIHSEGHEVCIMGRSIRHGRTMAFLGAVDAESRAVSVRELSPGWHLMPDLGPKIMDRLPKDYSRSIAERLTLAQWKLSQAAGWNFCIGGCMTLTSVQGESIQQDIVGMYPDYDRHRSMFEDPNEHVADQLRRMAA